MKASLLMLVSSFLAPGSLRVIESFSIRAHPQIRPSSCVCAQEDGTSDPSPEDYQEEINDMMGAYRQEKGILEKSDEYGLTNAVPIFTGTVFTLASIAACGYGIYIGLTGDGPPPPQ